MLMTSQIDPQTLRIAKILKQVCPQPGLEKDGSSQKNFAGWYDERRSKIDTQSTGAPELKKLRTLLDDLNRTKTLLETASDDTNAAYMYVKNVLNASLPLVGKGIHTLPNLILVLIFEELKSNMSEILRVSAVCRRFRKVILGESRLWATIRNAYSFETCNLFLSRSLGSNLSVHINVYPRESGIWVDEKFYKLLYQERRRIKELFIDLKLPERGVKDRIACGGLGDIFMPNLAFLSITHNEGWEFALNRVDELLCKLIAPRLDSYRGHAGGALKKWIHQLCSCEISFEYFTEECLNNHVQNLVKCQTLKLVIYYDCPLSRTSRNLEKLPVLKENLRVLRSLNLCFADYNSFTEHVGTNSIVEYLVTNFIPTEQLAELTIHFRDIRNNSKEMKISSSRLALEKVMSRNYDKLRFLNIIYTHSLLFPIPLDPDKMPYLEHLFIEGHYGQEPTEKFSDFCEQGAFPNIKTITFKNCNNLSSDYMIDIASVFSSERHSRLFQRFSLYDCDVSKELWVKLKMFLQDRFFCISSTF